MTRSEDTELNQHLRSTLKLLFATLPSDYAERRSILAESHRVFREELVAALEPAINAHIKTLPQQTYDDKKELSKWVNAELRQFGLSIRDPKSGNCCLLRGNTATDLHSGRFMLDYTDNLGKRHYPLTSVAIPQLTLMPDDLTRASYGTVSSRSR